MRKLLTLLLATSIAFSTISCVSSCKPSDEVIRPTPVAVSSTSCSLAGQHLQQLGCIKNAGDFSPKHQTFEKVCLDTASEGVDWNVSCLTTITSCDQIDVCTHSVNPSAAVGGK